MTHLTIADRDLWRKFRRSVEEINAAIERELISSTKLSGSDHGILSRLAESEMNALRQQELCDGMRWERTRLSHHLTRMEQRGLVKRTKLEDGGTFVNITVGGERARKLAEPVHADVVMRCFLSKLTVAQRRAVAEIASSLSGDA